MARAVALCRAGIADREASVAIVFAVVLVPIVLAAGVAIDYGVRIRLKADLDANADGAVLSVVNRGALTLDVAAAKTAMLSYFNKAAAAYPQASVTAQANVIDTNGVRTASLQYSATIATSLMNLAGIQTMAFSGGSQSNAPAPIYTDFYLVLDNTPSMGVGATPADVTKMVNNTSDKCAFACHDMSAAPNDYYTLAQRLGVTMRIDVVRSATQSLMDTAKSTALVPNQFRMAIYTLGTSCDKTGLTQIGALTTDLTAAKTSASAIDLMSMPYQGYNNDQCTDYDGTLAKLNTTVPASGNGVTATTPQKVVFFVADGVADAYYPSTCSRTTTGGRCQEPLTITSCTALKARGVRVAVLYTTYLPLPTNDWYNTWIKPFQASIGTQMQACASPGLYFEVSPTQGISDAMTELFQRTIKQVRLTQ